MQTLLVLWALSLAVSVAGENCLTPRTTTLAFKADLSLVPPPELIAQIDSDLELIAGAFPFLDTLCSFPGWSPGLVLLVFTPEAEEEWEAGEFDGFHELHELVGYTGSTYSPAGFYQMNFDHSFNAHAVAALYAEIPGVKYAFVNSFGTWFECNVTDIEYHPDDRRYFYWYYDEDCRRYRWVVQFEGNVPSLISGSGFPVSSTTETFGSLKARW